MQKHLACLISLFAFLFLTTIAQGAVSPLAVGIVSPVQFPPSDFTVTGLRASILWGHHRQMYGIDLGLLGNITEQDFAGLAVSGLFNMTSGMTTIIGLQAAGITNINNQKTHVVGLQLALINYNKTTSTIVGLGIAPIANLTANTTVYGAQVGLYNKAQEVYGFQIGLVNSTSILHGLQIGLINFHEKGLFSVCPIINVGF